MATNTKRKGIVLAGGSGSRLYPLTMGSSKQLLPIYDKPMIYHPISVLMLAGISEILLITTPEESINYKKLLGNGSQFGVNFSYVTQPSPDGIAQALIIGEEFIGDDDICLILGDNIFYGNGFRRKLLEATKRKRFATIFGYKVKDPKRFGVVEFDHNNKVISIEEKPIEPKSHFAVTGLYFYDNSVVDIAKEVQPSERGELEISSINQIYLDQNRLFLELLGRGFAWIDTGTHESLLAASQFVETIESRQGYKIACLEEIAFNNNWISTSQLYDGALTIGNNQYGEYLLSLYNESS